MIRQFELVEKIKSYDPYTNEDLINKAYVFSMKAHGAQKRASGDPYFSHPLEVAGILTDLKLDWQTIIAALLHDTVEDTAATLAEIEKLFGSDIAALVDGVTKLSQLEKQSVEKTQAENFRKLVLAMSKDIRVLLVKLADRLHNMRTLQYVTKDEKKRRVSAETMEIFAPLAGRIGLQDMRNELEDLAFQYLNPEAKNSVENRLSFLRQESEGSIQDIISNLNKVLKDGGVKAQIYGRQKTPYSIWQKMQRKNIPFEHLSDIIAFRIIVDSLSDCYQALGLIHHAFAVVPGRFKDYISTPKPNGYKSLHSTVLIPPYQRVEIQIRTMDMHREAELGVAAHWVYKSDDEDGDSRGNTPQSSLKQYEWLRDLLDILEQASDPREFLEHTKLEMFEDQVFCFSPKGDLVTLPSGATPVDFAYAVHSDVGNQCTGAKVNGKLMPLKTKLDNGDQVEIITSPHHEPSPSWERYVVTGKAKAHIRRFIKQQEREQYTDLGHAMLLKSARKFAVSFDEKVLKKHLSTYKAHTLEDIYVQVGKGNLAAQDVLETLYPEKLKHKKPAGNEAPKTLEDLSKTEPKKPKAQKETSNEALVIDGLIPGMAIHYAKCCHPLPGDPIVGAVTTGRGVTIHTEDCASLQKFEKTPERLLDLSWGQLARTKGDYLARLRVTLANEPGSLGGLSSLIGGHDSNISNLKIISRDQDFFDLYVDVEVHTLTQLEEIISHLRTSKFVSFVKRL